MKDDKKLLIGLGLGILAGAYIGNYLASEDGKKLQKDVKQKLYQLNNQMKKNIQEKEELINDATSDTADNIQEMADNIAHVVKEKITSTKEVTENRIEDIKSDFQIGVEKAKLKINTQMDVDSNI